MFITAVLECTTAVPTASTLSRVVQWNGNSCGILLRSLLAAKQAGGHIWLDLHRGALAMLPGQKTSCRPAFPSQCCRQQDDVPVDSWAVCAPSSMATTTTRPWHHPLAGQWSCQCMNSAAHSNPLACIVVYCCVVGALQRHSWSTPRSI